MTAGDASSTDWLLRREWERISVDSDLRKIDLI